MTGLLLNDEYYENEVREMKRNVWDWVLET